MTVASTNLKVQYTGNGILKTYQYSFKIFEDTDLVVTLTDSDGDTLQVLNTDYTVTGAGETNGGNVVFVDAPSSLETITIIRELPLTQLTDYVENDAFGAEVTEEAFDRSTMVDQQLDEENARSVHIPLTDPIGTEVTLPALDDRANKYAAFDNTGDIIAVAGAVGEYPVSDYMATVIDDADAIEARGTLGINRGWVGTARRPHFNRTGDDEIQLEAGGRYYHIGTLEQMLELNANLTFTFGPAGSNPASESIAALTNDWSYLYIDNSSLSGLVLTAANFLNSTTEPTLNVAKQGYYNGLDLCIGAFWWDGTNVIHPFVNHGDDLIMWQDQASLFDADPLINFGQEVTLRLPSFSEKALVTFDSYTSETNAVPGCKHFWRTNGATTAVGHLVGRVRDTYSGDNDRNWSTNQSPVYGHSTTKKIDVRSDVSNTYQRLAVLQDGYFLPRAM
jgi:hypothetical protein